MNLAEIKKSLEAIGWPWDTERMMDEAEIAVKIFRIFSYKEEFIQFFVSSPPVISYLISEIERLKLDEITRLCEFETMALENTRLKKEIEDINTKNIILESQDSVARTAEALVQSTNELNLLLPYVNEIRMLKQQLEMMDLENTRLKEQLKETK